MTVPEVVSCFVIGPIGNRLAPIGSLPRSTFEEALAVYEDVILPACEANSLAPVRADQIAVSGEITEQIFRHLRDDDLVIADVSGGNPNVMYELGLRHSTGKPTVQIGEFGQYPFDIAGVRTVQFSRSDRGFVDAREKLKDAITAALVEGPGPLTVARLWDEGKSSAATGEADVDTVIDEPDDEPGFLELMATVTEALPTLTENAYAIAATVEEIGRLTERSNQDVLGVPATAGPKDRLNVVARFASRISGPSEELEKLTHDFATHSSDLDAAIRGLAAFAEDQPQLWEKENVIQFYEMVHTLAESGRTGMEGLNSFASAAEGLGAISKTLRVPGKRISDAVKRMGEAVALMDRWDSLWASTVAANRREGSAAPSSD